MLEKTCSILMATGELSGEIYAADLATMLMNRYPSMKCYGMGSKILENSGVEIVANTQDLSIIGAIEVITKFVKIYRAFQRMCQFLREKKPDLLILIDYPGFNLRLAKIAKKNGVKVLYYITPKVWAWKRGRLKTIKKYVDMAAIIFPFEVELYQKYNIPAKYVGNPLLQLIQSKTEAASNNGLPDNHSPTVGLFPGSRSSEIKRLLPVILDAAKIIREKYGDAQFIVSQADSISGQELQHWMQNNTLKIKIVKGQNYEIIKKSDVVISASGTATLEIALLETPLVIIYKISWLEYQLAKRLIKIPYVGLCNILAQKGVARELLQHDASPKNIAEEVIKIIEDLPYRNQMIGEFKKIKESLEMTEQTDLIELVMGMLA